MIRMLRLALAATLLLTPLAHAQGGRKAKLAVRFLAERVPAGIEEVELVAAESRSEPFGLPTNHLSEPREVPARSFGIAPAGKSTSLATVTLPAEGSDFIVMLIPGDKGFHPVVIPAKDPTFRPGDVYFFNNADKTVLGYVGSAKFSLEPGKGRSLRPAGARREGFYDVGFGVKEKEGNRALSTTRWPVEENMRSYVFFFVNPTTKRPDFRAVDEFVPPDKPAR